MKPTNFKILRLVAFVIVAGLTIGLVSWDNQQSPGNYEQTTNDTVPKKNTDRQKKTRNLDDVLDELDQADFTVDAEKIKKEIAESLKNVDANRIQMEVDKAMMQVDMEKIKKEIETSMAKVDWDGMKEEIKTALANIDAAKIQEAVETSLATINWNAIKAEIENVKNIDFKKMETEMQKMKLELKELQPTIEKELKKAKLEIEKAKTEIKEYKSFVDGLNSDGLINKNDAYTLNHSDGELYINGEKATKETKRKYKTFLEKHKKFSIKKEADDFDFNTDN